MHWECLRDALGMQRYFGDALGMLWGCFGGVLGLLWEWFRDALGDALVIYWE